jgi:GNAT superfamily N-acetyltransferase
MFVATLRQPAFDTSPIAVRKARPEDAPTCGRICYEAFTKISTDHAFPPDFPSVEVATGVLSMMFTHPGFYRMVAESGGQILGSNCLDERSAIAGVGPITIDPEVQNKGVGRALMDAILALRGTRLPGHSPAASSLSQPVSCSLYAKLEFDTRELISTMQGPPIKTATPATRAVNKSLQYGS